MFSKELLDAMNEQMKNEFLSAYLYLAMSAHCDAVNLHGFAHWLRLQYQEETGHALKIFDYIAERGATVHLKPIGGPQTEWESPQAVFEAVLKHEQHVTSLINKLVDLAIQESDHASNNFLQWFVAEQVEEEASADAILQKLKLAGDDGAGLFMIDQELSQRVFTPPASEE